MFFKLTQSELQEIVVFLFVNVDVNVTTPVRRVGIEDAGGIGVAVFLFFCFFFGKSGIVLVYHVLYLLFSL